MNNYKYKFSVIMPIYNVELYLEQCIKSVLNQSIGFNENIQLILVNDGSTDKSEEICLYYKDKYPENIRYIKQENKGVSAARNTGMQYIEGKYVNFLDSDDKWDLDVFEKAYEFLEKYQNEIDLVACRQKLFEAKEGYHLLDYKFEKNRLVDIIEDYEYIQLSTSSAFIKSDVIKKYKYDTRLEYSEDAILLAQVLMEKSKYGILADAIYNYRKRLASDSALQKRESKKSWYVETIDYGCKLLIEKSIEKYGRVIEYIQYQIMYDIQWRVKADISKYLNREEKTQYLHRISELLSYIDDKIIMKQKFLWSEYKILVLCLKYKEDIRKKFKYKKSNIYFNDIKIYKLEKSSALKINKIKVSRRAITFKANITYFLPDEDYTIHVDIDQKKKFINKYKIFKKESSIFGNLKHYKQFKVRIPIKSNNLKLKFVLNYKGEQINLIPNLEQISSEEGNINTNKCKVQVKSDKEAIIVQKK